MFALRACIFASLAATVAFASAVSAASLPPGKTASGITLSPGPKGGRILVGHESGISNAVAGLRAAIAAGGGYFDSRPTVKSVGTNADGSAAYGAFDASLRGTPVSGIAIVALQSGGEAQVIALFDRPSDLRTSLRPMLASLGARPPASHASGSVVAVQPARPLREYAYPDGSGAAMLPADWIPTSANRGQLMAHDPTNTLNAVLGVTMPITDPRAGMGARIAANSGGFVIPYEADPADAYVAFVSTVAHRMNLRQNARITMRKDVPSQTGRMSYVVGDQLSPKGVPERFFGYVGVSPIMAMGGYNVTMFVMSGPQSTMPKNAATLAAIFRSYTVNGQVLAGQAAASEQTTLGIAHQAIANIDATGAASMANAANVQAGIDRSTSGFVHYLNGSDVVEHIGSGARASVDADFAQNLAASDPQNYRVVPMSQYRAGD